MKRSQQPGESRRVLIDTGLHRVMAVMGIHAQRLAQRFISEVETRRFQRAAPGRPPDRTCCDHRHRIRCITPMQTKSTYPERNNDRRAIERQGKVMKGHTRFLQFENIDPEMLHGTVGPFLSGPYLFGKLGGLVNPALSL